MEDNYTFSQPYQINDINIRFVLDKRKKVVGAWKNAHYISRQEFKRDFLVDKIYTLYLKEKGEKK